MISSSHCYLRLWPQDRCICCSWLVFRNKKSQSGRGVDVLPQCSFGTSCVWYSSARSRHIDLLHPQVIPQIMTIQKQIRPRWYQGSSPKTAIQASIYSINLKKTPIRTVWHSLLLMISGQSTSGLRLLASIPANIWYQMGNRLWRGRNNRGQWGWYLADGHWGEWNTIP